MNKNSRFSILITVYDQASEIKENLPAFLEQNYEPGYEVIVINESSTDETPDILKLVEEKSSRLYTTFLPKPNRQIIRRKLAFSLGLKASKNEWIMFTNIDGKMSNPETLSSIVGSLDEEAAVTLGYVSKKGIRLQSFDFIESAQYHIRKAERKLSNVYNHKYMHYQWGRYDFIIVRKTEAYEVLKFYEEKISRFELLNIRFHIFFKNLFGKYIKVVLPSTEE